MLSRTSLSCCGVKDVSNVNGGYSLMRPRQSGPSMAMKVSKPKKIITKMIDISYISLFFSCILIFLLYKRNRFHVAVRLFSNRSQRTSKCGKNISETLGCASCATFLFLPHFDVICDLLLEQTHGNMESIC